ncbi:MAG TPA: transglutaminaseTgpA domain-containing protein [Verrucomicrobiae bacterium]
MKSALNLMILLGFLCQGLTWDGYGLVLANIALWLACVNWPRRPVNIPQSFEGIALLTGAIGGYFLAKAFGQSTHFALGHGITLVQAVRLLRPLSARDKRFSLVAAFLHLGVGCTVVIDFRFVVILLGAVWLIPATLRELAGTDFKPTTTTATARPRFAWAQFAVLLLCAVLVFMLFPRGLLGSGGVPTIGGSQSSLMDSMLDPTGGGAAQSGRVIFEIQGDNLGYLRAIAMTEYTNGVWNGNPRRAAYTLNLVPPGQRKGHKNRSVRVKNVAHLGRSLPADGHVTAISGNFFSQPVQDSHEMLWAISTWQKANAVYEYSTDTTFARKSLFPQEIKALTQHPDPSPAVQQWVTNVIGNVTEPLARARKLEKHFQENFTYRIGAPRLSRLNSLEEFLLETKEGHCERYASSLALLLRMQGIPSRVVVGYVADQQNVVTGWRPVRFKDAHAWTEAWFPGTGWAQFDATPRSTIQRSIWDPEAWMEKADFVWNVYVVNFDGPSQRELMRVGTESVGHALGWMHERAEWLTLVLVVLMAIALWRRRSVNPEAVAAKKQQQRLAHAANQYGRMLAAFEKRGFTRAPQQTPYEFLMTLKQGIAPALSEAELITNHFCALRYGGAETEREEKEVEGALERLKKMTNA